VPLTNRIDRRFADGQDEWIRFRSEIPEKYERTAMAHYSVFYFLGRAAKRIHDEKPALAYPEDVFFLLGTVGDNLERFMKAMNDLGSDCGCKIYDKRIDQFPKGFDPFKEISDYRNTLLHDTVLGRGIRIERTYIPKWNVKPSDSPLHRVRGSWAKAAQLPQDDRISTNDLMERLVSEVCNLLETLWKRAVTVVTSQPFEQKMVSVTKLAEHLPLDLTIPVPSVPSASGTYRVLGSNTTHLDQPARSAATELEGFVQVPFGKS
jgi:hypothetical protein